MPQFTCSELAKTPVLCKYYFQVFGKSYYLALLLTALELFLTPYSEYEFGYD